MGQTSNRCGAGIGATRTTEDGGSKILRGVDAAQRGNRPLVTTVLGNRQRHGKSWCRRNRVKPVSPRIKGGHDSISARAKGEVSDSTFSLSHGAVLARLT